MVSIWLNFKFNTLFWLFIKKTLHNLLASIFVNEKIFNFVLVYIILPKNRKPAHNILNAILILSLSKSISFYSISIHKIFFTIHIPIHLCFGNNLWLLIIINLARKRKTYRIVVIKQKLNIPKTFFFTSICIIA